MAQQCCRPAITVKCVNREQVFWGTWLDFFVRARNPNDEIVFEGYTGKDGGVRFPVDCNLEHRISVYAPDVFSPSAAHRWVRLPQGCDGYLHFVFSLPPPCYSICKEISLKDRHYAGLPISRGEIFLWQGLM